MCLQREVQVGAGQHSVADIDLSGIRMKTCGREVEGAVVEKTGGLRVSVRLSPRK